LIQTGTADGVLTPDGKRGGELTGQTVKHSAEPSSGRRLFDDFSVEMTGQDIDELHRVTPLLPAGTRVNVTYLGAEEMTTRVRAAAAVREFGLVPIPHISARRLSSTAQLEGFLGALADAGATEHVFAVGGDPAVPEGPYPDALAVISSGVLQRFGVTEIDIAGYPEGHPDIPADVLWGAIADKSRALKEARAAGSILTQFAFDSGAVLDWIAELRRRGIELPVRVGVPGPAGVKRLLTYAKRFGVGSSAGVARKYGLSLTNLMSTTGPDKFVRMLASGLDPAVHGEVKLHFYTFGGLTATAEWIREFRKEDPQWSR
jgi:methylenetetrahydrofolate reductase (NADPH)